MADSYRLTILKRLTSLIELTPLTPLTATDVILPSTLAGAVFRGRAVFGDNDPETMVSILEAPRGSQSRYTEDGNTRIGQWALFIQGWCPDDKRNPTDNIYSVLEDVERQLDRITRTRVSDGGSKYPEHFFLGAALNGDGYLINSFEVGEPVVRPPAEGVSSKSFFYLPVQVGLARISV